MTLALATAMAMVALGTNGCGSTSSAPARTPSPAATFATAREDLSRLLVAPPGMVSVPNDPLSGPIDTRGVYRIFSDHAGDPDTILSHGFRTGHLKAWKNQPPAADPSRTAIPQTTTVTAIVLRFDTDANARAIVAYFKRQNETDGYRGFAVPATLSDGYGVASGPDPTLGITYHGVAWRHGSLVLQMAVQYTQTPTGTQQVTDLALALDART